MAQILASLDPDSIRLGSGTVDDCGRIMHMYVDPNGQPYHVLLVGVVLGVYDLGTEVQVIQSCANLALPATSTCYKLLVLGPPAASSETARNMYVEQKVVLHELVVRDDADVARVRVTCPLLCLPSGSHG